MATRSSKDRLRKLTVVFYRSASGNEPVRDWLKDDVPPSARKVVGADIKTVQELWPLDKPLVDNLARGLWEVRSSHDKVEYRTLFTLDGSVMVLLHGFTKTAKKTPKGEIDLALKRKGMMEKSK